MKFFDDRGLLFAREDADEEENPPFAEFFDAAATRIELTNSVSKYHIPARRRREVLAHILVEDERDGSLRANSPLLEVLSERLKTTFIGSLLKEEGFA